MGIKDKSKLVWNENEWVNYGQVQICLKWEYMKELGQIPGSWNNMWMKELGQVQFCLEQKWMKNSWQVQTWFRRNWVRIRTCTKLVKIIQSISHTWN